MDSTGRTAGIVHGRERVAGGSTGTDIANAPVVVLSISSLTPGMSPRLSAPDTEHTVLLSGVTEPLPPIIVHREGMRVIDGMHRVKAAMLRGDTTIRARLFDGTDDAAFLLAVRSNIAHGLPLTLAERKAAAQRILAAHPGWSDRAIAVATALSDKTVAAIRRRASAELPQLTVRFGADGRARPLDGDHRRRMAAELLVAHPQAPLREIATAAGISVGTVRDVRARVRRGDDPVPSRRRAGGPGGPEPADELLASVLKSALPKHSRDGGDRARLEHLSILERMRSDPSLRFSVSGRNAVRWLYTQIGKLDQWQELVDAIPLHWAEAVADLAKGCADSWLEFAAACEQRARRAG